MHSMEVLFQSLQNLEPTYAERGVSLTNECPTGFRRDNFVIHLGKGDEIFGRAVSGLQTWQAHRTKRTRVYPELQQIAEGGSVIVVLGSTSLAIAAPCRIVNVVAEEDLFGFAYGTLPGHPERGEESFLVRRANDGSIDFLISSSSRPLSSPVRLSGRWRRLFR
jgi:uncharacterized protein (UPF0548 family)